MKKPRRGAVRIVNSPAPLRGLYNVDSASGDFAALHPRLLTCIPSGFLVCSRSVTDLSSCIPSGFCQVVPSPPLCLFAFRERKAPDLLHRNLSGVLPQAVDVAITRSED